MSKKQLFSLVVSAGLLSATTSAWAATASGNDAASLQDTDQMLKKMMHQTQTLENQMVVLKKQIRQLKQQQQVEHHREIILTHEPAARLIEQPTANTNLKGQSGPVKIFYPGSVTIAPYLGDHPVFNAFDLIVNYSNYNEDLSLLQLRAKVGKENPYSYAPHLMFSGKLEGQAVYQRNYSGSHTSKFDLSSAELDIIPMINRWASGFMGMKYDNSAPLMGPTVNNSRMYIDRAFLTLGNLDVLPVYATLGQTYVPFGTYSSNLIPAPVTQLMFQTKGRALILGYDQPSGHGVYGQIYGFAGDASTSNPSNINDAGINLGVNLHGNHWSTDTGVGAITSVADALGMQQTGAMGGFEGFSDTLSPVTGKLNHLQRQVPGVAAHINFGVDKFGVNSEYITTTSSFAYQDMTFNGHPAAPKALHVEAFYNFPVFSKPSAVTVGFDHSWEALALNVPERAYYANFTTQIWADTIEQIEFDHMQNYGRGDTASGSGVAVPASQAGGSSNTVVAQLGIYF